MPAANPPLSISIVTYKTEWNVLQEALTSIANSKLSPKIYVVDNSPSDSLRAVAIKNKAAYIHSKKNLGFGRGHNLALSRIGRTSKYHLILNPDISFAPTVLNELLSFLEMNPEIGWVMPNILYPDGSPQNLCKRLPSPWDLFKRRFLFGYGVGPTLPSPGRFECADLDLTRPRAIPYLSGCFALMRTKLIQQVGGFDERFFLYLEDTDLARRIGEIALTVFYPYADVYHAHGRGSYKNFKLLCYHVLSAARYFMKWGWFVDPKREQVNRSLVFDEQPIATSREAVDWAAY